MKMFHVKQKTVQSARKQERFNPGQVQRIIPAMNEPDNQNL
jgi:hypothetical protein